MRVTLADENIATLALPAGILILLLGAVSVQLGVVPLLPTASALAPETVVVPAAPLTYRATGEFQQGGHPVDAPLVHLERAPEIEIMRYQVTNTAYARCVEAGQCKAAAPAMRVEGEAPVTGVSYQDATDYARWLSQESGATWRLPTVAEWDFVAGERAQDHVLRAETDAANPAERWIAVYEQEAAAQVDMEAMPRPPGYFGFNEKGVADLSANVWEWTSTCVQRTTLDEAGQVVSTIESCGMRYLEGRHRTPMNIFVRDARAGGCSVGVPPANLGFRLVRERPWHERLLGRLTLG